MAALPGGMTEAELQRATLSHRETLWRSLPTPRVLWAPTACAAPEVGRRAKTRVVLSATYVPRGTVGYKGATLCACELTWAVQLHPLWLTLLKSTL